MAREIVVENPSSRIRKLKIRIHGDRFTVTEYWQSGIVSGHTDKLERLRNYLDLIGIPSEKIDEIMKKLELE